MAVRRERPLHTLEVTLREPGQPPVVEVDVGIVAIGEGEPRQDRFPRAAHAHDHLRHLTGHGVPERPLDATGNPSASVRRHQQLLALVQQYLSDLVVSHASIIVDCTNIENLVQWTAHMASRPKP